MFKKFKLANVPIGKSVEVFEKRFTVLDHTDDGVLVLSESIETNMPFQDRDIYRYLNGEYLDELKSSVDDVNAILDMEIDLRCVSNRHEYETGKIKAGLLTVDQYEEFYEIIPIANARWWLAMPYDTLLNSPNADFTGYGWVVNTNGSYDGRYYYDKSYGIRPALVLSFSLDVSCDGIADDKATPLSYYSNEELLKEIKRRLR